MNLNMNYYDIESLGNVFTLANYKEPENIIDIYILCDTPELTSDEHFQEKLLDRIYASNHNFNGGICLFDLSTEAGCDHLAKTFGLSDAYLVNDPNSKSSYPDKYRPVCDTDKEYIDNPDKYPYFAGYNSTNYDTTMLAEFFYEVFYIKETQALDGTIETKCIFKPTTARLMREINDDLFNETFKDAMPTYLARTSSNRGWGKPNYKDPKWLIRKSMLMTGRQIDVSILNEKQRKVALKRLLGMMGFQILESDKLGNRNIIENEDQLLDLIAYNISDVVNLAQLFHLDLYQAQFTLKKQLLHTYPELVYEKLPNEYAPDIRPEKVRRDRLYIDSTSSQFAQKSLCPYGHLKDIPYVSFNYPHPDKAKELGIPVVNVLEEARKFFYSLYPQEELRAQFDNIYHYYKSIEGKNFNESDNYTEDYADTPYEEDNTMFHPMSINQIQRLPNTIPYFDKDGNPTSCFANFSVGGVHGAEYNKEYYDADISQWLQDKADLEYAKSICPDATTFRQLYGTKPKEITMPDGTVMKTTVFNKAAKAILTVTDEELNTLNTDDCVFKGKLKTDIIYLLSQYTKEEIDQIFNKPLGLTMPDGRILDVKQFVTGKVSDSTWKDIDATQPTIFKTADDGSTKLNDEYSFTSDALSNHEDFTSYYPNLLRMMKAFYNDGLGYDRYAEIFQQKQDYGHYMKDKKRPQQERDLYKILREGTKLILNSASGAGDATFDNNIRMNNAIISMRIIGQLFSWRIGQAQSYKGAKIISTNTDGLYSVMEAEINDKILAEESANIGVEIEPEPLYLISKDTNNRIEMTADLNTVLGASGGTLACRKGPKPDKALSHPAIIDWALAEYLIISSQGYKDLSIDKPFNETIGMNILKSASKKFEPVQWLTMFQNVLASAPNTYRYIFGITDEEPNKPIILKHYNRAFYMKDKTPNTMHLLIANAKTITDATKIKRQKNMERPVSIEPLPLSVLRANGLTNPPPDKDITQIKVTNIGDNWYVFIQNKDLHYLTQEEFDFIINNIDYDKYLMLLQNCYENNWRNILPNRIYLKYIDKDTVTKIETRHHTQPVTPIPQNEDHFIGWNTMKNGQGVNITDVTINDIALLTNIGNEQKKQEIEDDDTKKQNKKKKATDVKIYAIYDNQINLTLKNKEEMIYRTFYNANDITLPEIDDSTFLGWNTEADGNGTYITVEDIKQQYKQNGTGNFNLYAIYPQVTNE